MTYPPPPPPDCFARFAAVQYRPELAAAYAHEPKRMTWVNLAILVVLLGAAVFAAWYVALASHEFAERRDQGVKMGVLVTLVVAIGGWLCYRDWKRKSSGAVRRVLAIIGDKSESGVRMSTAARFRMCHVTLIEPNGAVTTIGVQPHVYDRLPSGALGMLYFLGDAAVEFRALPA